MLCQDNVIVGGNVNRATMNQVKGSIFNVLRDMLSNVSNENWGHVKGILYNTLQGTPEYIGVSIDNYGQINIYFGNRTPEMAQYNLSQASNNLSQLEN